MLVGPGPGEDGWPRVKGGDEGAPEVGGGARLGAAGGGELGHR